MTQFDQIEGMTAATAECQAVTIERLEEQFVAIQSQLLDTIRAELLATNELRHKETARAVKAEAAVETMRVEACAAAWWEAHRLACKTANLPTWQEAFSNQREITRKTFLAWCAADKNDMADYPEIPSALLHDRDGQVWANTFDVPIAIARALSETS